MELKYKNKPSEKVLKHYCKKLEEFLSAHNISVSIKLWDPPLQLRSYMNGELTKITNEWIEKIVINNDEIGEVEIDLYWRDGIPEDINNREIWQDVALIQDQLYHQLQLKPPSPPSNKDPYWKLWDHLEKLKE